MVVVVVPGALSTIRPTPSPQMCCTRSSWALGARLRLEIQLVKVQMAIRGATATYPRLAVATFFMLLEVGWVDNLEALPLVVVQEAGLIKMQWLFLPPTSTPV